MKALFKGQYVWEIVHNGYAKSTDHTTYKNLTQDGKDTLMEQRKKDGKALFYMHQAMQESIIPRVEEIINAKQEWDTLEISY